MKKYKFRRTFTFEGKRYQIYADSEADLIRKMTDKKVQLKTERKVISGSTTLRDWAYECINTYKTGQNDTTREKYIRRVRKCILDDIGNMRLKDIKPLHVQRCINLQTGKSKTQINEVYNALKFIFRHAYHNHMIKDDPTEGLTKPKSKKSLSRRALTPYERQMITSVGKTDRRYYLFLLMLYCGCRPAEAAEATGGDIVDKGNGVILLHIRGTKTTTADRFVPLPEKLYRIIKDTEAFEPIAANRDGKKLGVQGRTRAWQSFKRQLNIAMGCRMYRNQLIPPLPLAPDLVPYCLRHEYCTDLARRGVDIRIAQKLMGHSDIKLTANIYTNLDDADIVETARLLNHDAGSKSSNG